MASLLFGKKIKNKLTLIGTVTIGKKKPDYQVILNHPKDNNPSITKRRIYSDYPYFRMYH